MIVTLGHISHICGNRKHKPKRFVVHADEKLTAFVELEAAIRAGTEAHPKT
jgi:hypothetical protein